MKKLEIRYVFKCFFWQVLNNAPDLVKNLVGFQPRTGGEYVGVYVYVGVCVCVYIHTHIHIYVHKCTHILWYSCTCVKKLLVPILEDIIQRVS
jgi:hypothetical protein